MSRGNAERRLIASVQPLIKVMAADPVAVTKNQTSVAVQITVRTIPSATMATGHLAVISRGFFVDDMGWIAKRNFARGNENDRRNECRGRQRTPA